ncbi:MAG: hypothetical protein RL653_3697 [Pseudomonadota bacterium]|jgi:phosphoribosyl 1,2-cyclic phosphodiesterase
MSVLVKFWGTRGSVPTPGRRTQRYGGNTSCVELRAGDATIVCDGGTGLREFGVDLFKREPRPKRLHMFFSHPHWDHIQGFPFFGPAYDPETTLFVYGAAREWRIHELLSGQMVSHYFPVSFRDLGARIIAGEFHEGRLAVDGVNVTTFEQHHPGVSLGYVFEHEGVRVAYCTDSELDAQLPDSHLAVSEPAALRPAPEAVVAWIRGVDLLIADGQWTDEEYPRRVGWGHPRASTVVDVAVRAGVKQLAIFHHDPHHSDGDVDAIVEFCRQRAKSHGSPLEIFGAREGMAIKVG